MGRAGILGAMLPLLLVAWTALAAPDPVDPVTARVSPGLRAAVSDAPVRVVVEGADAKALATIVATVPGVHVEVAAGGEVQLTIPARRVASLARLPGVRRVREPFAAIEHLEVTSEGVEFLLVSDWHALGITGQGVKIAVLDTGFSGLSTLQTAGEIPNATGITCFRTDQPTCLSSQHGSAVAEIVHDMAPDAEIDLYGAFLTSEWQAAAEAIADGGYDIVTSSIGFGNFAPIDGQSAYADTLNDAVGTSDLLWFQAAGNLNPNMWTGIVTDTDSDGFLEMAGHEEIPIVMTGTTLRTDIRWDDDWGGADNDIDALLVARDSGGAEVAYTLATACPNASYRGDLPQTGSSMHTPWERLDCSLPGTTVTAAVKLHVEAGTGAGRRVWLMNYAGLEPSWVTNERSVSLPSDAAKAIAVGAIGINDSVVRNYSGRGPTDDGRVKPDLVGPSTGATATWPDFNGTSATTPHLAGLAALVLQNVRDEGGDLDRAEIIAWITSQSVDLGTAGKDNFYGAGLPQLDETWSDSVDTGDTGTDTGDTGTDTDTDTGVDTDTGADTDTDTDSGGDDTDTGDLPDMDGCQCATGGPVGWTPLLLALAVVGRRRTRPSRLPIALVAGALVACADPGGNPDATPAQRAVVESLSARHGVDCAAAAQVADDPVTDLVWVAEQWQDPGWVAVRAAECVPVVTDPATAHTIALRWSADPALIGLADAAHRGGAR